MFFLILWISDPESGIRNPRSQKPLIKISYKIILIVPVHSPSGTRATSFSSASWPRSAKIDHCFVRINLPHEDAVIRTGILGSRPSMCYRVSAHPDRLGVSL